MMHAVGSHSLETRRGPGVLQLTRCADHWSGRFIAMACPCEVLIEDAPRTLAQQVLEAVAETAWRIERKFSRYRQNSVIQRINQSAGCAITVDEETANLLDFATALHRLSNGRFDVTSGALRKAWTFDGGDRVPDQEQIDALLAVVGWDKVTWDRPKLTLASGMQLDFGGIGKEYAVDRAADIATGIAPGLSCLINFGGDIAARYPRHDAQDWRVGIEHADRVGVAMQIIHLAHGAMATSGDSRRYVYRDGHRYSHILDARTGWPVRKAPHSITVAADTCTQAGTLTTLAMLEGEKAESFLQSAGVRFWLQ